MARMLSTRLKRPITSCIRKRPWSTAAIFSLSYCVDVDDMSAEGPSSGSVPVSAPRSLMRLTRARRRHDAVQKGVSFCLAGLSSSPRPVQGPTVFLSPWSYYLPTGGRIAKLCPVAPTPRMFPRPHETELRGRCKVFFTFFSR